jgi:hypothetical protein
MEHSVKAPFPLTTSLTIPAAVRTHPEANRNKPGFIIIKFACGPVSVPTGKAEVYFME